MEKFTQAESEKALTTIEDWKRVEGREALSRKFIFKDFQDAFAWMTKMAMVAEKMDHHPEWLNIWNSVDVTLSTHDAQGITQKDIDLAQAMDIAFKPYC